MKQPDDPIDGLVEYIARRLPNFRQNITGCKVPQVRALEIAINRLTRMTLPLTYKNFLLKMGGDETPFSFTYDASSKVGDVVERHQQLVEDGEKLPADSFLIAVFGTKVDSIALECGADGKSGKVFIPNGEAKGEVLADSLVTFLFGQAFQSVTGTALPVSDNLTGKTTDAALASIEATCAKAKIKKQWFSDSVTFCGASADDETIVFARQKLNGTVAVKIAGKDRGALTELSNQLCAEANLQPAA